MFNGPFTSPFTPVGPGSSLNLISCPKLVGKNDMTDSGAPIANCFSLHNFPLSKCVKVSWNFFASSADFKNSVISEPSTAPSIGSSFVFISSGFK